MVIYVPLGGLTLCMCIRSSEYVKTPFKFIVKTVTHLC